MSPLPWSLGWSSPAVVRYPGFQKRARRADEKLARTGHFQRRLGRRHVAWALPVVAVDSLLGRPASTYTPIGSNRACLRLEAGSDEACVSGVICSASSTTALAIDHHLACVEVHAWARYQKVDKGMNFQPHKLI
jgi:hypothetical protein